jgi:hypothetical protein
MAKHETCVESLKLYIKIIVPNVLIAHFHVYIFEKCNFR